VPNAIVPNGIMLNIIVLYAIVLYAIVLNAIVQNVAAPQLTLITLLDVKTSVEKIAEFSSETAP
jgi:hypothetical protein